MMHKAGTAVAHTSRPGASRRASSRAVSTGGFDEPACSPDWKGDEGLLLIDGAGRCSVER